MAEKKQQLMVGLAGLVAVATVALAWKFSRNDAVAQAANHADNQTTLPKLADEVPAPPVAAPQEPAIALSKEERRLQRYDKDADGGVNRDEFLANRKKAFAKLDVNKDGRLSFEEYAVKTIEKFAKADADGTGILSAAEFASTAQKRAVRKVVDCPPEDKRED